MTASLKTDEWPSQQFEVNNGPVRALAFTPNGGYLISGDTNMVRVWQKDGKEMAMPIETGIVVDCLAVSKDGRWITVGTSSGRVVVWDTASYEKVFERVESHDILGVDFSPDSTRLVVASANDIATVWDVDLRQNMLKVAHRHLLNAAKYSPQGDRIATANLDSVRVWDSTCGRLLMCIEVRVTPWYDTGLLWLDDHLFVVSGEQVKRFDASTGLLVSEFTVPDDGYYSCIALPRHGEFIAHSTRHTITFWDTSESQAKLAQIDHACHICSIAFSPEDLSLAFGGKDGKIIIKSLTCIKPPFQPPDIQIDDIILDSWKLNRLVDAELSLTLASVNGDYRSLYCLAFIRARLKQWNAALADAEKSIKIRRSVFGYIAKSTALAFKGEKYEAYRACDMAFSYCDSTHIRFLLLVKAIIVFISGEHDDGLSRIDDLIATDLGEPVYSMVQAYMYFLIGNSRTETGNYHEGIQSLQRARDRVKGCTGRNTLFVILLIFGWQFDHLDLTIRQQLCEALLSAGRMKEAGDSLLQTIKVVGDEEVYTSRLATEWVSDFTQRCLYALHNSRNTTLEEVDASVRSVAPSTLLREWAKATLLFRPWRDALISVSSIPIPRFMVYLVLCERLEMDNRMVEATECFHEMENSISKEKIRDAEATWISEFGGRCSVKLIELGDIAMDAEKHDDAITHYSAALSFNHTSPNELLVKRSKAYVAKGAWEDALNDANEVVRLDPPSPWGHERRYVALRDGGNQKDMIDAFEMTLTKMSESKDPDVRARWDQCTKTKSAISQAIQVAIRDLPRVLLHTASGQLCDKSEQSAAFEASACFTELVLSMATGIDHSRIEKEVTEYYHYATFSHKWEPGEPLFEEVMRVLVYKLEGSLAHDKLRMFCKIVREAGFNWAWSDTCCINKADPTVLQEAIIAIFKWYQCSAMTIVFLRGVRSRGGLIGSIWNSRAWTFQEYHASNVVRFYTEDWKPYPDVDIPNHKDSPQIISEMEKATRISARVLTGLSPGLDDIRTKLCLASHRETTLIEDEAYSLLGMFSVSMSVVYGEGDKSLGRLLAQLLTSSGDTSILAWTGTSGGFNSCLPARISVFKDRATTHIPPVLNDVTTTTSRSSLNPALVMNLYDKLCDLPVPLFIGKRMKLPCLTFKLGRVVPFWDGSAQAFRAQTNALGVVEIKTGENLSGLGTLYIIHPWIDFLLDQQPVGNVMAMETVSGGSKNADTPSTPSSTGGVSPVASPLAVIPAPQKAQADLLSSWFGLGGQSSTTRPSDILSLRPPSSVSQADKQLQASRAVARLRQPFGALLLAPALEGVAAFRRVATESLIRVQVVEQITPMVMKKLIEGVRIVDVL